MDSNYEAQKQYSRQRLAARREQAAAERMLKEGRPARMSGLKQLLVHLFAQTSHFHRPSRREEKKRDQKPSSPSRRRFT